MVKRTRRIRGGVWYDPRTWFSSSSDTAPVAENPTVTPDTGLSSPVPTGMSENPPPYGGRKKTRRGGKRRGTKSRRKH